MTQADLEDVSLSKTPSTFRSMLQMLVYLRDEANALGSQTLVYCLEIAVLEALQEIEKLSAIESSNKTVSHLRVVPTT